MVSSIPVTVYSRNATPWRVALACALATAAFALLLEVSMASAQEAGLAAGAPVDTLSSPSGWTDGSKAAAQQPAAPWFWKGFAGGAPIGVGAAFTGTTVPAAGAGFMLGGAVALAIFATRRIELTPQQEAMLADADSVYAVDYRTAYTTAMSQKRGRSITTGALAGAGAGFAVLGLIALSTLK